MDLRVTKVNRIFADGNHNAFPSMTRFGDWTYVCFRSARNHLSFDGAITVIRSRDRENWEVAARLESPLGEYRDPTIIEYKNRLFLYAGKRYEDGDSRDSVVFVSDDGVGFEQYEMSGGPENLFFWHATVFDNVLYATAYVNLKPQQRFDGFLFKSSDGREWEKLLKYPLSAGEIALDFDEDGTLFSLIRDDYNGSVPHLAKAVPPYNELTNIKTLPMILHGPCLKRLGNHSVIIGRDWDEPGRFNTRTDIHVLSDSGKLSFIRTLPSGGDTSYASWLDLDKENALLVYYSAHEYKMDAGVSEKAGKDPAAPEHSSGADIYIAHISHT